MDRMNKTVGFQSNPDPIKVASDKPVQDTPKNDEDKLITLNLKHQETADKFIVNQANSMSPDYLDKDGPAKMGEQIRKSLGDHSIKTEFLSKKSMHGSTARDRKN